MIKRLTWWAAGAAMGAVGSGYAKRKVKKTVAQLAPSAIAGRGVGVVKDVAKDLKVAFGDGRTAMRERETELRDRLEDRRRPYRSSFGAPGVSGVGEAAPNGGG